MATQVMGQSSGGGSLFNNSANMGMALTNDMYDLHELSKAELAAPQLIMLANVALTGEASGSCCDYLVGEERQMAELMPVGDNHFSESEGEGLEESADLKGLENMELGSLELSAVEPQPVFEASAAPEIYSANKDPAPETPVAEDKCRSSKAKPFRCKPCQYEAESEEQCITSGFTALRSSLWRKVQRNRPKPGSRGRLRPKRASSPKAPSAVTAVATIPTGMTTTWHT